MHTSNYFRQAGLLSAMILAGSLSAPVHALPPGVAAADAAAAASKAASKAAVPTVMPSARPNRPPVVYDQLPPSNRPPVVYDRVPPTARPPVVYDRVPPMNRPPVVYDRGLPAQTNPPGVVPGPANAPPGWVRGVTRDGQPIHLPPPPPAVRQLSPQPMQPRAPADGNGGVRSQYVQVPEVNRGAVPRGAVNGQYDGLPQRPLAPPRPQIVDVPLETRPVPNSTSFVERNKGKLAAGATSAAVAVGGGAYVASDENAQDTIVDTGQAVVDEVKGWTGQASGDPGK